MPRTASCRLTASRSTSLSSALSRAAGRRRRRFFTGWARASRKASMVEPSVRSKAMIAEDQQQVWSAVNGAIAETKSRVQAQAAPAQGGAARDNSRPFPLQRLMRQQWLLPPPPSRWIKRPAPAVGANNEANNEIVQAAPEAAYCGRCGRRFAAISSGQMSLPRPRCSPPIGRSWCAPTPAESLHAGAVDGPAASREEALKFLSSAVEGHETSEGTSQVYQYKEIRGTNESLFVLRAAFARRGFPHPVLKRGLTCTGPKPMRRAMRGSPRWVCRAGRRQWSPTDELGGR